MNKLIILFVFMLTPAFIYSKPTAEKTQKSEVCATVYKTVKKITGSIKTVAMLYFFRDIAIETVRHLPEIINAIRVDHTPITAGDGEQF